MASSKLSQISQIKSDLQLRTMSKDSLKWLKTKIVALQTGSKLANPITKERSRFTTKFKLGRLYCFYYDPIGKDDLPYYDKFPLTLVLEQYSDGFLGLNLHYLPIRYRIAFLQKLMDRAMLDKDGGVIRVRVTYDILNAAKRFREFKPCLKRYLFDQVRSRILAIEPEEFDVAACLPVYQFKGAKPKEVWRESVKEAKENE